MEEEYFSVQESTVQESSERVDLTLTDYAGKWSKENSKLSGQVIHFSFSKTQLCSSSIFQQHMFALKHAFRAGVDFWKCVDPVKPITHFISVNNLMQGLAGTVPQKCQFSSGGFPIRVNTTKSISRFIRNEQDLQYRKLCLFLFYVKILKQNSEVSFLGFLSCHSMGAV